MDEKAKNWFDKFSLGCSWHGSGDCQAITNRDENERIEKLLSKNLRLNSGK